MAIAPLYENNYKHQIFLRQVLRNKAHMCLFRSTLDLAVSAAFPKVAGGQILLKCHAVPFDGSRICNLSADVTWAGLEKYDTFPHSFQYIEMLRIESLKSKCAAEGTKSFRARPPRCTREERRDSLRQGEFRTRKQIALDAESLLVDWGDRAAANLTKIQTFGETQRPLSYLSRNIFHE